MTMTGPEPLRVAVVGAGEWGKNHVRMFAQLKGARLVTVCDLEEPRLADVRAAHPDVGQPGLLQVTHRDQPRALELGEHPHVVLTPFPRAHDRDAERFRPCHRHGSALT